MSLISRFKGFFSSDLYIQVWESRLKIFSIQTKNVYDQEPLIAIETNEKGKKLVFAIGDNCRSLDNTKYQIINPFKHPRVLLNDFELAEKVLQHAIKEIHDNKVLTPASRVIFQPMEKIDGGLSSVEERAFIELCYGAGAREVIIHIGNELLPYGLDFDEFKKSRL